MMSWICTGAAMSSSTGLCRAQGFVTLQPSSHAGLPRAPTDPTSAGGEVRRAAAIADLSTAAEQRPHLTPSLSLLVCREQANVVRAANTRQSCCCCPWAAEGIVVKHCFGLAVTSEINTHPHYWHCSLCHPNADEKCKQEMVLRVL